MGLIINTYKVFLINFNYPYKGIYIPIKVKYNK